MSSSVSYQEDESILFKHKCSYNKEEGDFIVTTVKVCFIPFNPQITPTQLPWGTIAKVRYSPLNDKKMRVMVMVEPVVSGTQHIFQLLGEFNACQTELERLKPIIKQYTVPTTSTQISIETNTNTNINTSNAASSSSSQNVTTKRASDRQAKDVSEKRKKWLEADQQLFKKYRDLVLGDKILTDEQFWDAFSPDGGSNNNRFVSGSSSSSSVLDSSTGYDYMNKGKVTSLLSDVFADSIRDPATKEKGMNVLLSPEVKEQIFQMYPAVQYAFKEQVQGLLQTEQEFWISYFQSEYYNQDKGVLTSSRHLGRNILSNRSRIDDIISDFELSKVSNSAATSASSATGTGTGTTVVKTTESKKKITGLANPDVDLTSTFGDYRPPESMSQLLPVEDRHAAGAIGSGSRSSNPVVDKYNRHGKLLMGDDHATQIHTAEQLSNTESGAPMTKRARHHQHNHVNSTGEQSETAEGGVGFSSYLPELQHRPSGEEQFIPLALHKTSTATGGVTKESANIGPTDLAEPESDNNNAFAKRVILQRAESGSTSPGSTLFSVSQIQSTLSSVWPNTEHAALVNRSIVTSLREAAEVIEFSSGQNEFVKANNDFIQGMLQLYGTITELLRLFYAMLGPSSNLDRNTTAGQESIARVEKLVGRFTAHREALSHRLHSLETSSSDRQFVLSCRAVISDMTKLLSRAENKWDDFRANFLVV